MPQFQKKKIASSLSEPLNMPLIKRIGPRRTCCEKGFRPYHRVVRISTAKFFQGVGRTVILVVEDVVTGGTALKAFTCCCLRLMCAFGSYLYVMHLLELLVELCLVNLGRTPCCICQGRLPHFVLCACNWSRRFDNRFSFFV